MKYIKLSDIATIYNGNSINKKVKQEKYMKSVSGWNYISTKDIDFDGTVTYKNGVVIPYDEAGFKTAPPNTVFVCSEGGSAGKKTAYITEEVCFGNKLYAIVNNQKKFNGKYIYYYTRSREFFTQFKSLMTGIIGGVSTKKFSEIQIPMTSLQEQGCIVAKIEELFSELDNSIENLKKIKQQLVVYRQAVLADAFSGRFTNSKIQNVIMLSSLIEKPRYGTSKKCNYTKNADSVEVYRIPNIDHKRGLIDHSDVKYATFADGELKELALSKDDILIIRSNGSVSLVGRAAIVRNEDINGTFAGYLMRLRIQDVTFFDPQYLLYYLQSTQARIYIENKAKSTSGVHNINSSEISGLEIPFYDYSEQVKIVKSIETRLSHCDAIEKTVDTALQQAEALRQSILKKAFEGNL